MTPEVVRGCLDDESWSEGVHSVPVLVCVGHLSNFCIVHIVCLLMAQRRLLARSQRG